LLPQRSLELENCLPQRQLMIQVAGKVQTKCACNYLSTDMIYIDTAYSSCNYPFFFVLGVFFACSRACFLFHCCVRTSFVSKWSSVSSINALELLTLLSLSPILLHFGYPEMMLSFANMHSLCLRVNLRTRFC